MRNVMMVRSTAAASSFTRNQHTSYTICAASPLIGNGAPYIMLRQSAGVTGGNVPNRSSAVVVEDMRRHSSHCA